MMKQLLVCLLLAWSSQVLAAGTQYELRVDGLACPFCAYGIEKKLMRTPGVESVEFDLEKGLVIVSTDGDTHFDEAQMRKLIKQAGFSLRAMAERSEQQ